jgi:CheY-like chemotaxis protein
MMAGHEAVSGQPYESGAALMHSPSPGLPRILVVERDQGIVELLFAFLKSEGYEPSLAVSPEQALERMNEQTFHLVLTDLFAETPRRLFTQVRHLLHHTLLTPVGLMTGWQIAPEAARRQGFAFHLQKPFDLDLLLAEIDGCLHQALSPEQERQLHAIEQFMEALQTRNLKAMQPLLAEDITYYPPFHTLPSTDTRPQGLAALVAYFLEIQSHYRNVAFDGFLLSPRPNGWAMRYCSHWPALNGSSQVVTGTLLFHFRKGQIHQIGLQWNDERLHLLLSGRQGASEL